MVFLGKELLMAKKFGKFLLFTAAVGAAGAAAYYFMQKKDAELLGESDDDYDDFSEDLEDESSSRTYVPLNHDETSSAESDNVVQDIESVADDFFTPLAEQVTQAAETAKDEMEDTVEEFFDDEDSADE